MANTPMNEQELDQVTGGLSTPMGDFSAQELINMYNADPSGAASLIKLAKAMYPNLVKDFKEECRACGLTIPDGLKKLLG